MGLAIIYFKHYNSLMKINSNNKLNLTLIINGAVVGLITAIFIELFKIILDFSGFYRTQIIQEYGSNMYFKILTFALLFLLAIIVGKMVKKEPSIGGSGISEAKVYVNMPTKINHRRQFFLKYIGSIMVLSAGLTAGRVGPSVNFGAMVGIEIGERNKLGTDYTILLVLAGIASGICSIFGAPLAGMMFVLEVITDDADENVLTVMLSSVFASFFVVSLFSHEPVFALKNLPDLPLKYYYLIFILIIFTVIFSKLFNHLLLKTFDIMKKIPLKNEYIPVIPFLLTGVFYFTNINYVGFEHNLLMTLKDSNIILTMVVYFIVKLILTLFTYGSRVPGGMFFPVIFLGSVAGLLIFKIGCEFFVIDQIYLLNFVALGIVAFLTGVYKAPLTASVLIIELTGSLMYLLPVIFTALLVQIGTDYLDVEPVHNLLLRYRHSESNAA